MKESTRAYVTPVTETSFQATNASFFLILHQEEDLTEAVSPHQLHGPSDNIQSQFSDFLIQNTPIPLLIHLISAMVGHSNPDIMYYK